MDNVYYINEKSITIEYPTKQKLDFKAEKILISETKIEISTNSTCYLNLTKPTILNKDIFTEIKNNIRQRDKRIIFKYPYTKVLKDIENDYNEYVIEVEKKIELFNQILNYLNKKRLIDNYLDKIVQKYKSMTVNQKIWDYQSRLDKFEMFRNDKVHLRTLDKETIIVKLY